MKLALFDKYRLGLVEGDNVVDVTSGLPWPHDEDPVTAGWWRRLCRDFDGVREGIEEAAREIDGIGVLQNRVVAAR